MKAFYYKDNQLYIENVPLTSIAQEFGTPSYVYSKSQIEWNWREFNNVFANYPHRICYAVKANSNLAILNILAKLQSGFDIVSQGELERVIAAGGDPKKVVFSGVGKQMAELARALDIGIFCFNIESESELERLNQAASKKNVIANIALRINPNIDARTHPYIATGLKENKFGIELKLAKSLARQIKTMKNLQLIGIGCHIGSQLTEMEPFLESLDCLLQLVNDLAAEGIKLQHIDVGGGLGICYQNETPPSIHDYAQTIKNKFEKSQLEIILEPGRSIVANTGVLLTKVEYLKHTEYHNFAVIDAGMNDFMRPALYNAWQNILPIRKRENSPEIIYDIVGPVCESADFLGKNRKLNLQAEDLLAIADAGAYGFCMSSNYNSRPRAAEIMVNGNDVHLIRRRESLTELFAQEKII